MSLDRNEFPKTFLLPFFVNLLFVRFLFPDSNRNHFCFVQEKGKIKTKDDSFFSFFRERNKETQYGDVVNSSFSWRYREVVKERECLRGDNGAWSLGAG